MKNNGFTLIELLIAVVIFSMVIGMATYSFRLYLRLADKTHHPFNRQTIALSKMRDSIKSTFFYVTKDHKQVRHDLKFSLFFNGTPESVEYISSAPAKGETLSLTKIHQHDGNLIIDETPLYTTENNFEAPFFSKTISRTTVVEQIKDLNFSYISNMKRLKEIEKMVPSAVHISYIKDENMVEHFIKIESDYVMKKNMTEFLDAAY